MSGTSLDGLDIADCSFTLEPEGWNFQINRAETYKYSENWKIKLAGAQNLDAYSFALLHKEYGEYLGKKVLNFLENQIDINETVLIYSMWKEYINPKSKHAVKRYVDFVSKFPGIKRIHTSGHASAGYLTDVCNLVNPTSGIIPIHSEKSGDYRKLKINKDLNSKIITSSKNIGDVIVQL